MTAEDYRQFIGLEVDFALTPDDLSLDETNAVSSYWHSLAKSSPARTWWDAAPHIDKPAVARALRIDPKQGGALFGLLPFRLAKIDARWTVLVAWPCPRHLGPFDVDWLGIEQVLAWDPVTDAVSFLGDGEPGLFGGFTDREAGAVYGSPREFFQAWVDARAVFYERWRMARMKQWAHGAAERDLVPGVLVVGEPREVPWRPRSMPPALTCVGIDPAKINRAIIRSAHLPRAH